MKIFVVLTALLLAACNNTGVTEPAPEFEDVAPLVDPINQTAVPTATETAPPPTATLTPSPTPTPTATPWVYPTPLYDPTESWERGLPEQIPANTYAWDDNIEVYVALGSDYGSWRVNLVTGTDNTDAFIITILQDNPPRISLISVPRDLYVFIPGFGMSRINTAWRHGGAEMVADTLRYNFGLPMHGYGYVRMEAFSRFIDDALHGLMVEVRNPVLDYCSDIRLNLLPGIHFMDGPTALCYGRVRAFDGGFNRQIRQRELLQAMKAKFLEIASNDPVSLGINIVETYISEHRYTDIGVADIARLLPVALNAEITEYQLGYETGLVQFTHPESGAWLVLPPSPACMSFLMDAAILGSDWINLPEECETAP